MFQKLSVFSLLFIMCVNIAWIGEAAAAVTIQVDTQTKLQTITGWEATAQAGQEECGSFDRYSDSLYKQATGDLGINRLRLEIFSGAENPVDYFSQYINGQISRDEWKSHWYDIVNDNNDPNKINLSGFQFAHLDYTVDTVVLPMKQLVEANGEELFINLNYVDFGGSAFEHKQAPEEYAEFVLATYQHLQSKYGWVPDAWEAILEPDNAVDWSGSQIGRVIAAAGNRLQAAGYTPAFIAPSTTSMSNAPVWFNDVVNVGGASSYLTEIAYHRYTGVNDADLQTIANLGQQYGIGTSMLEHIGSDYHDLHKDLKMGQNTAWQQYTLGFCTGDDGAQYYWVDESNPQNPTVNLGSRTRFLRQYFKYIRAGAVRLGASTENGDFDPLAFENQGGSVVIVVKTLRGGTISIQGLPSGEYGIRYTTSNEYDVALPNVQLNAGRALTASIPAAGVITIFDTSGIFNPQPQLFLPVVVDGVSGPVGVDAEAGLTTHTLECDESR